MNMPHTERVCRIWRIAVLLLLWCGSSIAAPPLPPLGVESTVTVSGLSSGGYMAAQEDGFDFYIDDKPRRSGGATPKRSSGPAAKRTAKK